MSRHLLRPALRHVLRFPRRAGGAAFDADATALIAAMTTEPDSTRQTLINDTIVSLKNAGIWAKLDELWFTAAHDQQAGLLGWKRYKDLTAVNAPTFTADRGFAGNGTSSYLNTNFVPSTDGVNYTLNDASFGVYSRTDSTATVTDIGASNLTTSRIASLLMRTAIDGNTRFRANIDAPANHVIVSVGHSLGLQVTRRTASNAQQGFVNGVQVGSNSNASTNMPEYAMFIGAQNIAGTPDALSTRQYAFGFVGGALSAGEQSDFFDIVESYMDSIGAGVVT